ncbi:PucR family transcriptional regulator [Mycobacterium hubeiense]|uniref:PucR family transcriptional regulator n=1 Tax=Mycobacterium hubeiense TaxID=1867256 RepID=UPI000C7E90DE|nr:helix-turn-helix domain-containing protein [Mycobacterium sp. QGD 101]
MARARAEDDAAVADIAAAIVAKLGTRLDDLNRSVQQLVATEIPALADDAQMMQLLHDSVEGNIDTVFSAIRHGIPIEQVEPPTAALEHARRLAQRAVSVNALVRSYRLGHKAVLDAVRDEVRAADLDATASLDVFGQIAEITFGYVDWISQQVVTTYQSEYDRWTQKRNSLRALRIREILGGAQVDVDEMTGALSYPLRRTHLAAVLWCDESGDEDELVVMERFVTHLAESAGAREAPLFLSEDRLTGWAWIPLSADAAPDAAAAIRAAAEARADAPCIALGTPLPGVEGFRRSHRQARDAHVVATASGPHPRRVTAAGDPGLRVAALPGGDVESAAALVAEILGPLAERTDNDERLRETLRVFLRAGASYKAAAEELHLHVNSVKYRVAKAVERRGRPIAEDRLDVEVALLLCQWYGDAVLRT